MSVTSPGALPPPPESHVVAAEARGLRWLLVIGSALIGVVCAVEWSTGVINAWDRWLQPAMAVLLLGFATALARWPRHTDRLRLGAVVTFNAYIALTLLVLMLALPPPLNQYQFMSTAYWLPLGYGTAFVFLRTRLALWVSYSILVLLVVPIGSVALLRGTTHWGPDIGALLAVLGVGQIAYILLLKAIATMRAGYHRSEQNARAMHTLATTDALTGLPNRRALLERLQAAVSAAQRHGEPVTVALIDVDHFKSINDRHGHAAGDRALVQLGHLLAAALRPTDMLGRWGGEEFLLVCGHTHLVAGQDLAERLRASVEGHAFAHGAPVTVSIGLTRVTYRDDVDGMLARADAALYRAKANGRNRIELWKGTAVAAALGSAM
jgi:diguanylate cyclase (GGDEF)-like protein